MQQSSSLHLSVVSCSHDSQEVGLGSYVNAIHYIHCTLLTSFATWCVGDNFLRYTARAHCAVPCVSVISQRVTKVDEGCFEYSLYSLTVCWAKGHKLIDWLVGWLID